MDTASVIVSTNPDVLPVMRMRKLRRPDASVDFQEDNAATHYRTQHGQPSSFQICSNSWISWTASCSCRRSPPVLTMTDTQSQLADNRLSDCDATIPRVVHSPRWPYGELCRIRLCSPQSSATQTPKPHDVTSPSSQPTTPQTPFGRTVHQQVVQHFECPPSESQLHMPHSLLGTSQ